MLVGKDLLISSAEVTHNFAMLGLDMSVEIRPSEASNIAIRIWTIVSQKEYCVFENDIFLVFNTQILVGLDEVLGQEIFVAFGRIVGKYHEIGLCLDCES